MLTMKIYREMFWKYCFCAIIVLAYAKSRRGREGKYSGLDLLQNRPLTSNRHLVENLTGHHGLSFPSKTSGDVSFIRLNKFLRKRTKAVTVEFVGYSGKKALSTLFGIYYKHKPLPLIEVSLDIIKKQVILRYQGVVSFQRVTLTFGKELEKWNVLSAEVNRTHFTVIVGCTEKKSVQLRQKIQKFPRKVVGVLGSDKFGKSKFTGQLFEARFYPYATKKKTLLCSKPVKLQQDEGYVNDAAVNGDRILLLEQQITQLNNMVDMLKGQNANLTGRVTDLEGCCDTDCVWEGQMMEEGETWNKDKCTVCICKNSKADCLRRTDIPSCNVPCTTNPCMNHGQCVSLEEDPNFPSDFQCLCQPPYDGQYCEYKENPCVWPRESGICDQNLPRFYYDTDAQLCLPFNYTGCGGNINNYETLEECQAVAIKGACCYRQYSLKVQDITFSEQQETFGCKEISLSECQSTHRQIIGETKVEVISFYPGVTCKEADCGRSKSECIIEGQKYDAGSKAVIGCQECTCESSGQFVCSCSQKAQRKEIRDMTAEELARFQAAIQQLRLVGPGNPWEEFRDIYMQHTMHSNGGPYFLPWHRLFLRKLEQKLQEIDCSITLPYYDFSTDVGNFSESILWQPNYFGGNGIDGCVVDHPFGLPGSWRPCIRRTFNQYEKLPTLLELSLALASEDYTEMSRCLESYASYIHTFIGGDMATRAAPYDPLFYSVHAYIDMLYWWWQQRGSNKFQYPAPFANIPMVPFNVPPSAILDLEADLCVEYIPPGEGAPCKKPKPDSGGNGRGPIRGDVVPQGDNNFVGGFNTLGYNKEGFDRRGFNDTGFRQNGYNRDNYNKEGYDIYGYNRYGYDKDGYSPYGYDIEGWDRNGVQDKSGRYNAYGYDINCLDRRGLTSKGFDKYGFNLAGSDMNRCDYFYNGPYATRQSWQIWQILLKQPKAFIMTLSRTCPGLDPLPRNWLQQYWITDIKDVTDMIPSTPFSNSDLLNSARFCFDIDDFVTPCECDLDIAVCPENPCKTTECPSYPESSCRLDFCGTCRARFYLNGKEVDCTEERDFCQPNPCENGGTCVQSIWPSEPQLTTCLCPPGYDGHYCQYTSLDVCDLPLSTGGCTNQQSRWYFDPQTQSCKSFIFSGCGGNANNFMDKEMCENRCKIGACCYRIPKDPEILIGYDRQGYDLYGYNLEGVNRRGDVRLDVKAWDGDRYDWQGYDQNGFDKQGYDRMGLDKSGFNRDGFNLTGYSRIGEYDGIIDYNDNGYDTEGYSRAGYTCFGTNRDGQNSYGVNSEYVYKCRSATLYACQKIESRRGNKVVKFVRGKTCDQVKCEERCGCNYDNKTYNLGETFRSGCQFCTCTLTGSVDCTCSEIYRRKEIRDLTKEELEKYQNAIKSLAKTEYPSKWFNYAKIYADYRAQALGNAGSLPWHRYFLKLIEKQLQEIDCSITIPYYDWTLNAGNQDKASIWAANVFGGDGSDINGCVTYHPFKDYYPPYLVPCIRRRFNTSVPLPDVVDIQYALNEPTYERFRLSMEVFMDIYKTWVGGHMDSEFSAYDPLFLSVAAFVDRIWWDWQNKYDNGQYRYPQDLRYIPLMPFKTTPDDVMDSKRDLCVTYYPLSEAAACNVTLPNLNYNSMGYDRHGFNREGYDIEGFNRFGVDKDGNPDERGIFNVNGFDREGFKRSGYDNTGWDRFGFFVDNYNVDGYDPAGYDRRGYDRYGFDKSGVTPFGFYKNGTQLVNTLPNVFDASGYNRYGLNRYGFDREGYDIFGFDTMGYDRRRCNKYFLGPMLVIIRRWAEVELEKADNRTIRIITRICPQVDDRPEWRYTLNWLKRGDQVPLIEGILGRAQARVRELEEQGNPLTEGVWLPVGPDKSLCFVTYYYTECPFGKFPVECEEDLCLNRQCPGYPSAICRVNRCGECSYEWYNGVSGALLECSGCIDRNGLTRAEGTSWSASDCESCKCEDGKIMCVEIVCPVVTCTHPVKYPGQCCLQCDAGCDYNGILYKNEDKFKSPDDKCFTCQCTDGSVTCNRDPCPALGPCSSEIVLEGECCPTCLDCGNRENGEQWMDSPCQSCTCEDGRVECERIQCIPPDCSHPRVLPGQCCASCQGCTINGQDMYNGDRYMQDKCTECVCQDGNVFCDPVPCPVAPCADPLLSPGDCCPRCDLECEYAGRFYRHGDSFVSDEDRCSNCTCVNSIIECNPVTCPRMNLPCRRPITVPGDCCPTLCPKCVADGVEYENGAQWQSRFDPCERCVCEEGINSCTRIDRCPQECEYGVFRPDECCSDCTDCVFDGLQVRDRQTFMRPGDNCQRCTCSRGEVTCESLGPCPRLPCRVTETPPGGCCPQCKTCQYEGRTFNHGDTVSMDKCSTCYCREGEISCERVACPETKCRYPSQVPGECCPACLQCEYKGKTYDEGARFTPLREPCLDCVCRSGEVTCETRESDCPVSRCTHPIKSTEQCCPICDGCLYLRKRFRSGQKFVPPGQDNCQVCRCMQGSVTCMNMGCPPVNCNNAVLVKGQCCPVCPMGCNVMGIEYRDGQTFIDFMDRCKVCTCMMGQIWCMAMMSCEPVTCTHPAMRPGNCCPSCTKCDWNNNQYRNGEIFTNPSNLCEECTCKDGSVICRSKALSCRKPNCLEPVLDPDTCCPVCQSQPCVYAGRQYREGQVVPASGDICETCRCSQGLIDCVKESCPRVPCTHPGRKECCDTCEYCKYNGMQFELGEMFPNKDDPCEDCVCQAGSVRCMRRLCGVPNCQNPVYKPGSCCPECSDCTYQGIVYRDEEDFPNPTRPCEICHCMKGSVACDRQRCPQVSCQFPASDGCCPVCKDCQYNNQRHRNGDVFSSQDGCGQCRCMNGNVQCDGGNCPEVTCDHPVTDRCCQSCTDCLYENRMYRNGQTFDSERDECSQCTCRDGTVTCRRRTCPRVSCDNPVQGRCCPECGTDCSFQGRTVRNGEYINRSPGQCDQCRCDNGNLNCDVDPCLPVNCNNPIFSGCCPVCDACNYNGVDQRNGESFANPFVPCSTCVCRNGNVDCAQDQCPPVTCPQPYQGSCCLECPELRAQCMYGRTPYRNGDIWPDTSNTCNDCTCANGQVQCYRKQCPPVTCPTPITVGCCPSCEQSECVYEGASYRNGDVWADSRDSCSECTCVAGQVDCDRKQCPPVRCSNPVVVGCCPTCGECSFEGRSFRNGDIIPDPRNPCKDCFCEDGEVRCNDQICPPITCGHPVQGECCPECRDCQLGAQRVSEGSEYPDLNDSCSTCMCKAGTITCEKAVCEPVRCSDPGDDGCCPRCDNCIYHSLSIRNRQTFTDPTNQCRQCTCQDGTVTCQPTECRPVTCSSEEREFTPPGGCCPVCGQVQASSCYRGWFDYVGEGEVWSSEECFTCWCINGEKVCSSPNCLVPNCGPNDIATLLPESCCPVCLPKPGTCHVYGDPHYRTFDGADFSFQGTCQYTMAKDCGNEDFNLEVRHDDRGIQGVSWAQHFILRTSGIMMHILQNHEILVNNRAVELPYNHGNGTVSVERVGDNILVNTRLGVRFVWDGRSQGELMVPGNYKRKLCGLCGNFNGFPQDDLRTKSGQIVSSNAVFGNSWKVADQGQGQCSDAEDGSPCTDANYRVRQEASSTCEVIRGPKFSACHRVVSMNSYFDSCVFDLCACTDKSACLCDILSAYAKECTKAGVRLEWRSPELCSIPCDAEKGFVFDECGPVCERNCNNWKTPLGHMSENCYKPCVPGCRCSADKVVHEGKCITTQECPSYTR